MYAWITSHVTQLMIGLVAMSLLLLILTVISLLMVISLRGKLKKWKAIHATADLDEVYKQTKDAVAIVQSDLNDLRGDLKVVSGVLSRKVSSAVTRRYNAFSETGSDLSFSIALLDDHQDGVVISSIYGREESRTYAKPIRNGESAYALTDDEQQVIMGQGTSAERPGPVRV